MTLTGGITRGALVAELAEVVGAPHEARFIVDEVLGLGLVLGQPSLPTGTLDVEVVAVARRMAARRADGEPLQYVFGHWPFRSLDLLIDRRVLIPRPETEQVVEVALTEARRLHASGHDGRLTVVDAGTGSGAIALSLAAELEPWVLGTLWATDTSTDALAVARANLRALARAGRLPPSGRGVEFTLGSWFDPLPATLRGHVDLVVSNPPYVSDVEWDELDAEVRAEPREALVAGPASDGTPGLSDVEVVLGHSREWLGSPGAVVVELAPHQAQPAADIARSLGYVDVDVLPDLSGRSRALRARTVRGRASAER